MGMTPTEERMKKHANLGEFIAHFGAAALARALRVDPSTITLWKQGKSQPTPERAKAIVALAKGRLTLEGVYRLRGER